MLRYAVHLLCCTFRLRLPDVLRAECAHSRKLASSHTLCLLISLTIHDGELRFDMVEREDMKQLASFFVEGIDTFL